MERGRRSMWFQARHTLARTWPQKRQNNASPRIPRNLCAAEFACVCRGDITAPPSLRRRNKIARKARDKSGRRGNVARATWKWRTLDSRIYETIHEWCVIIMRTGFEQYAWNVSRKFRNRVLHLCKFMVGFNSGSTPWLRQTLNCDLHWQRRHFSSEVYWNNRNTESRCINVCREFFVPKLQYFLS